MKFWFTFQVNLCSHRKKDPRFTWTLYKHDLDKNKKCLFVGNFRIVSVIVCGM